MGADDFIRQMDALFSKANKTRANPVYSFTVKDLERQLDTAGISGAVVDDTSRRTDGLASHASYPSMQGNATESPRPKRKPVSEHSGHSGSFRGRTKLCLFFSK
jgi:hypothetical protein